MSSSENSIVIVTYPDKEAAKKVAGLLVEERLAACAQIFPIESIYSWEGKIFDENEIMLFIKTKTSMFDKVSAFIRKNHSYDVPEIIQIPITDGLPEYLRWIGDNVDIENNG